jgi:hypothetical protein
MPGGLPGRAPTASGNLPVNSRKFRRPDCIWRSNNLIIYPQHIQAGSRTKSFQSHSVRKVSVA